MNTKLFLSLIFGVTTYFSVTASPLPPDEALNRVLASGNKLATRSADSSYTLSYTCLNSRQDATLYVFNKLSDKGYMVVSADDLAFPLLGYCDSDTFDSENIPPQLLYWLQEYSRQIDNLRSNNSYLQEPTMTSTVPFDEMDMISPLLKSKWNQGAPYNEYCYTIAADGEKTKSVTGCVATSMAQVMYYFKFPEKGQGEISYSHPGSGIYTMNFGDQAFDWDNMLSTYVPDSYTTQEADAVAYLMKACGYSVKMDYSKGEAGANGAEIAGALIKYFNYNDAIEVKTRDFYTYNDWATMIYENLKNVGPVVYNGSALDGGHSFVCDGYDGNGYFHFNWGWGGMSDGYYLLDALNPDEFGIGGAAGGYNLGQQIILNISPYDNVTSTPHLMQFGNVKGEITDNFLKLELTGTDDPGFQYINPEPISLSFGVEVNNTTNPAQENQYFESSKTGLHAEQGSFFRWDEIGLSVDLSQVEMTEGDEYDFIIATKISHGNSSAWHEVVAMTGKFNYVTIIKSGSGYEITNHGIENLHVENFKIESDPVYINLPVKFIADFINNSSQQLTRNYSAVFFNTDDEECYKMENYSITVNAGTTLSDSWTSIQWYKEKDAEEITTATEFKVRLYDNWQGEYIEGIEEIVTIYPAPAEGKVESEFTLTNGVKDGDIYVINGNEIEVSLTVKVIEGSFNHTLMLAIQAPLDNGEYYTIMHKHFDAIPNLSEGEEQVFDMSVVFEDAQPDKIYRVEVWGEGSGFNEKVLVKFDLGNDAIQSVKPDFDGSYHVYNIHGILIYSGDDSSIIENLPYGIYIVNGKKLIISK